MKKLTDILNEVLSENYKRDKSRKVLYVKDSGGSVVYDHGDYVISFYNINNPTNATLWYKKTESDWEKVGRLNVVITERRFKGDDDFEKYYKMDFVNIDSLHRGKGLGTELYKAIFDFADNNIVGMYSYLPNRSNKIQVPAIYKKLGSEVHDGGDTELIRFK